MKNLTCVIEGVWKEDISEKINNFVAPVYTGEEAIVAEAMYLSKKPILEAGDIYQLIAVDVSVDGENCTGIINCRVNGEHEQIRF